MISMQRCGRRVIRPPSAMPLEWFDFTVFRLFAGVIGKLFFSAERPDLVAALGTFAIFGIAFAARPLGGWFGPLRGQARAQEGAGRRSR